MSFFVNTTPPERCWHCQKIKPPASYTNIMSAAAGSVPSVMKPLCDDCSGQYVLFRLAAKETPAPGTTTTTTTPPTR